MTTLFQTIEKASVRRLIQLPLFGAPVQNKHQEVLSKDLDRFLKLVNALDRASLHKHTITKARKIYDAFTLQMSSRPTQHVSTTPLTLQGRLGPIPALVHTPSNLSPETPAAAIVLYHGGGFTIGSAHGYANVASTIAQQCQCKVINVDYRRAPEHPFPCGMHDAIDAFKDTVKKADALGIDPHKIGVAGDSAGGTLSLVVALAQTKARETPPKAQLIFYPLVQHHSDFDSRSALGEGFFLTQKDVENFSAQHLPQGHHVAPEDAWMLDLLSPEALSPETLAPSIMVTAGFDPLRDEGLALTKALKKQGWRVEHQHQEGMSHGFFTLGDLLTTAHDLLVESLIPLRSLLHT